MEHNTILIGTNNPHKADELRAILEGRNLARLLMPADVPSFPTDIPETGVTLEENAFLKTMAIRTATNEDYACLADDTGLEVDALHGAPGVYSARYAGEQASFVKNRAKLLSALQGVPAEQRTARFRTVICYADGLRTVFAEGVCEGRITTEERGAGGFGYDAVFLPNGYDATFAELSADEKNRISHRSRALELFVTQLEQFVD